MYDPRPDLESDSPEWERLLLIAALDGPDAPAAALRFIRACGGQLRRSQEGAPWRIVPSYDRSGDQSLWRTIREWEADRAAVLLPHKEPISAWLKDLAAERDPLAETHADLTTKGGDAG